MNREISAYKALRAIESDAVEQFGIPKIYYVGNIFGKRPIIVMTLFDECLDSRWKNQNKKFNMYTTLQVFLQSVRITQNLLSFDSEDYITEYFRTLFQNSG